MNVSDGCFFFRNLSYLIVEIQVSHTFLLYVKDLNLNLDTILILMEVMVIVTLSDFSCLNFHDSFQLLLDKRSGGAGAG